jgi:hypothetical protein
MYLFNKRDRIMDLRTVNKYTLYIKCVLVAQYNVIYLIWFTHCSWNIKYNTSNLQEV